MTEATELITRHCVFGLLGESCAHLRNEAGYDQGIHIRVRQEETMDHIGAGQAELHWGSHRYIDAVGHEIVLGGYEAHGDRPVGLGGGAEIALDEFALQMQGCRVNEFDIAGRVQGSHDAGHNDDRQHDEEHSHHNYEPAVLSARDNIFWDDAVRQ
jgi:hypothetical protein